MLLRYTTIANYVQTVETMINYAGLRAQIRAVPTRPYDSDTDLGLTNPLGTVPTLVRDDGAAIYGGPVIYEYLDTLHDRPRLYPDAGADRAIVLTRAWLADGMFDAMVRLIVEGWEPAETHRLAFIRRQWSKVTRGLDQLEADAPGFGALEIGQVRAVGAIAFIQLKARQIGDACAELDPNYDWSRGRPALADWYARVSSDPIFTQPLTPAG